MSAARGHIVLLHVGLNNVYQLGSVEGTCSLLSPLFSVPEWGRTTIAKHLGRKVSTSSTTRRVGEAHRAELWSLKVAETILEILFFPPRSFSVEILLYRHIHIVPKIGRGGGGGMPFGC